MKIITYNVNGIRAALQKDFISWLRSSRPNILCLQEIRATSDDFDQKRFEELGYRVYLNPAKKKGYAGVAILSLSDAVRIETGMGANNSDDEGRVLLADYPDFSIISVYMPSGASSPERQAYKLDWILEFQSYISTLLKEKKRLIIGGDFNICHQPIDIHNPFGLDGFPGFTEVERVWMSGFLHLGLVDCFRVKNSFPHQYTWWSYRAGARSKNLGWRIDYLLASKDFANDLKMAGHLTEAIHSDHCPVFALFKS